MFREGTFACSDCNYCISCTKRKASCVFTFIGADGNIRLPLLGSPWTFFSLPLSQMG